MLSVLEGHHGTLSTLMEEMRGLIAVDVFPQDAVAQQRLKLSQASSARTRYLADVVYPALLDQYDGNDAVAVRSLRHDAAADRAASSLHVAKWTSARLALDWHGFRRDSAVILSMMERRIARERDVLYGLLRDAAGLAMVSASQRAA